MGSTLELIKINIDRNIDMNAKDICGRTAFFFACHFGHKDVVQLLLKHSKIVDTTIPQNFSVSQEIKYLIDIHQK